MRRLLPILLLLAPVAAQARGRAWTLPPDSGPGLLRLLAPFGLDREVGSGYTLRAVELGRADFTLGLAGAPGLVPASVRVRVRLEGNDPRDPRIPGLRFEVDPPATSPGARAAVELLGNKVRSAGGEAWAQVARAATRGPPGLGKGMPSWAAVLSMLPARPPDLVPGAMALALLAALGAGVLWSTRRGLLDPPAGRRSLHLLLAAAVTALTLSLLLWAFFEPATGRTEASAPRLGTRSLATPADLWRIAAALRDHGLCVLTLAVAAAGLLAAGASSMASAFRRRAREPSAPWAPLALQLGLVLGWSFVVRFGLTELNVVSDGQAGLRRLLEPSAYYGGVPALVQIALPGSAEGFIGPAMQALRALAALAPGLVLLLGRELGLRRGAAALAGLALASLPLHATLYSSDDLGGAVLSVALAGLWLCAHGARRSRGGWLGAGLLVCAFAVWGRPETLLLVLPLALILTGASSRTLSRLPVLLALGWLGVQLLIRYLEVRGAGVRDVSPSLVWLTSVPWIAMLGSTVLCPFWLWLPALPGAALLPWRTRLTLLAGLLWGLLAITGGYGGHDETGTHLELFRYGVGALPWAALAAGAGIEALTRLARPHAALLAAAALGLMATPLLHMGYLGRRYAPSVEEAVFREALTRVPAGCWLAVPDDLWTGAQREIKGRYVHLAAEVAAAGEGGPGPDRVVGMTELLRAIPPRGYLPRPRDPGAVARGAGPTCWYAFRGTPCFCDAGCGVDPACRALDARLLTRVEEVWPRPLRGHRLLSRPDLDEPPWVRPEVAYALMRIQGSRGPGGPPPPR